MVEAIKNIARGAGAANPPCTFMFGMVVGIEPLTVQVDNRFFISGSTLVLMKSCINAEHNTHRHKIISSVTKERLEMETDDKDEEYYGLAVGDKVALIRENGGQRFLVLGVIA